MAIEDDDIRNRELWTSVSRHWYSKASDKSPTTGRLYHHLAILARPNGIQQLFYYYKSLSVPIPFPGTREWIMTLFDPIMQQKHGPFKGLRPSEVTFVKTHGILFSGKGEVDAAAQKFADDLDSFIERSMRWWETPGYKKFARPWTSSAFPGYDHPVEPFGPLNQQDDHAHVNLNSSTGREVQEALQLSVRTHEIGFGRFGDPNVFPYLHTALVFIHHLSHFSAAVHAELERNFPWKQMALMLNTLIADNEVAFSRIEADKFPTPPESAKSRPLPEDFAMRGLLWADQYFPSDWFDPSKVDDDEEYLKVSSMAQERKERILWLGRQLLKRGRTAFDFVRDKMEVECRDRDDSNERTAWTWPWLRSSAVSKLRCWTLQMLQDNNVLTSVHRGRITTRCLT